MVFKNKFFLDLGSEGEQQAPATIAPPTTRAAKAEVAAPQAQAAAPQAVAAAPAAGAQPASQPVSSQTTAEAIAAELAAEQANRPAPSLATFAPECVTPGGAMSRGRRRGGADLGGFREMARGMLSS